MKTQGLWLALFLCAMLGCSHGKLDRNTAAAQISQQLATMGPHDEFEIGRIGSKCAYNPETHEQLSIDPNHDIGYVLAVKAGYASVVPDGQGDWKTSLTTAGKAANPYEMKSWHITGKGCDYTKMIIRVAKPVLVRVSGIIQQDDHTAVVDFEWKWELSELAKKLRENGEVYSSMTKEEKYLANGIFQYYAPPLPVPVPADADSKIQQDKLMFIKYDDGWRLQAN